MPVAARTIEERSGYGLKKYMSVFVILILGLIIYSNQFQAAFHYDDYKYILENDGIKNLKNISGVWEAFARRKVTALSFALTYHFSGSSVVAYHVANVGIHLASALLVYAFVQLIFKTPEMRKDALRKRAKSLSLAASLIFLCHPVQTNAVTYIWQRTASQAALFYLGAVTLYVAGRVRGSPWYFIGAFLSMILAVLSKENTVTVPLMCVACELCFFGLWKNRKRLLRVAAIGILMVLAAIPLYYVMGSSESRDGMKHLFSLPQSGTLPRGVYFLTELNVLRTYVRLLILPVHLNLDYDYPISKSVIEARTLLSALLLSALLVLAAKLFERRRLMAFGILWFFITLSPESSIIPINDVIVEYRLYLAMTGFALFIAALIHYLVRSARMQLTVIAAIALLLGSMTYNRNSVWADEVALWQDVVHKSPAKARAHVNLGFAYLQTGAYDKAIEQNEVALKIEPTHYLAWYNLALAYSFKGEYQKSIEFYLRDIEYDPDKYFAYCNLGITYRKLGQIEKAIECYRTAIGIKYNHLNSHYSLAQAYLETGDYEGASKEIDIIRKLGYADAAGELESLMRSNAK